MVRWFGRLAAVLVVLLVCAGVGSEAQAQGSQGAGVPEVARQAFANCVYCDIVGDFYERANSGAASVSANVAGMLKPFASALFSMWLSWRLLAIVVPFVGGGSKGLGDVIVVSFLFMLSMAALNAWGGGSTLKRYIYDPVLAAAVGGSGSISAGVASSLSVTPLGGGGACSGNLGKQAACATWAAGSYAAVGVTLGYSMMVGHIDGGMTTVWGIPVPGLGVMWDKATQVVFGLILMVVWAVSMLLLPVIALVFVMKVTLLYAFAPIFVLAVPFPVARSKASKALSSLVGAGLQLWGIALVAGIVGASMQGLVSGPGGGWGLVARVYANSKALTVFEPEYIKLLVGGILSLVAMLKVSALITQFADDAMGAAGVNGGMVGKVAGGAAGALGLGAGALAGGIMTGGGLTAMAGGRIQKERARGSALKAQFAGEQGDTVGAEYHQRRSDNQASRAAKISGFGKGAAMAPLRGARSLAREGRARARRSGSSLDQL